MNMICFDLIVLISEYSLGFNYHFLNKSLHETIIMVEKGKYWKEKYDNFFRDLDKEYLILKGDYNWKQEYIRILRFNSIHWTKLNNTSKFFSPGKFWHQEFLNFSFEKLPYIPKEIGNLINLTRLEFTHYRNFQYPKELHDLCYSIYKKSGEFYM